jgi:tetratricopeptide (TPR) repeat protein
MKAWLADTLRLFGALPYWNTRKTLYILRGRSGQCPCHNPSDSGEPGRTGCEAVVEWESPARFRRAVCPLLVQRPDGGWVCSVGADQVRPFWGRFVAVYAVLGVLALVAAGFGTFFLLRQAGLPVSPSYVFSPARWGEFNELRAQRLTARALAYAQAGQEQEALDALLAAQSISPGNYERTLLLARMHEASAPEILDNLYRHAFETYPTRRNETALAWLRSLLARGDFEAIAKLARQQLAADPAQQVTWLQALLFSVRTTRQAPPLQGVVNDPAIAEPVRVLAAFEFDVRRGSADSARSLLRSAPPQVEGAYARVQRVELLLEFGLYTDAIEFLARSPDVMSGRDLVRLALAVRALAGDRDGLQREVDALLAPDRAVGFAEISTLNEHLIRFPDRELVLQVGRALPRLDGRVTPAEWTEAWIGYLCAAGSAGDLESAAQARDRLAQSTLVSPAATLRLGTFFQTAPSQQHVEQILPYLTTFRIELTYALRQRFRVAS